MTDSQSESSLEMTLFAAAAGDEEAWRRIVAAYADRVFALVRVQCGDADLAEEITQSTFCTVASKLAQYTELGRFEPWLFRIAMNRLRDEMRRRRRQARNVESDALAALAGTAGCDPGDRGSLDEDIASLRQAMIRLPEADREVLHLRHYAGLSFRQIAQMLDQPLGTVLARQHRALRKLAEMLTADGEGQQADISVNAAESHGEMQ